MLKRGHAEQSGQSMVEFALVGSLFFLLIFGMFDLGFYFYTRVTLQNAVRQGARYAITGNCGTPGSCFNTGGQGGGSGDRLNTIINTVVGYSFGLISASQVTVTSNCASSCGYYGDGGPNNAGGPGDTVTIQANYTWNPWVLGNFLPHQFPGSVSYAVSSVFKNETFPPAS
ncbi:MAG: TadE family protein [Candidatus Korobacteraceae bacterium]